MNVHTLDEKKDCSERTAEIRRLFMIQGSLSIVSLGWLFYCNKISNESKQIRRKEKLLWFEQLCVGEYSCGISNHFSGSVLLYNIFGRMYILSSKRKAAPIRSSISWQNVLNHHEQKSIVKYIQVYCIIVSNESKRFRRKERLLRLEQSKCLFMKGLVMSQWHVTYTIISHRLDKVHTLVAKSR